MVLPKQMCLPSGRHDPDDLFEHFPGKSHKDASLLCTRSSSNLEVYYAVIVVPHFGCYPCNELPGQR